MKKELDFELNLKQKYSRFMILYSIFFVLGLILYNDTKELIYALIAAVMLTATVISYIMRKNKRVYFKGNKLIYSDIFGNSKEYDIEDVSYRKQDVASRYNRYSPTVNMVTNYKLFVGSEEIVTVNVKMFSDIEVKHVENIIKTKKIKEHNDNVIKYDQNAQIKIRPSRVVLIGNMITGILFLYISIILIVLLIESKGMELFVLALLSVLATVYFLREFFILKNSKIVYVINKGFYKGKKEKYYDIKDVSQYRLKKHFVNDVYREIVLFMKDKSIITITNDCYGFFEVLDGLKIVR